MVADYRPSRRFCRDVAAGKECVEQRSSGLCGEISPRPLPTGLDIQLASELVMPCSSRPCRHSDSFALVGQIREALRQAG